MTQQSARYSTVAIALHWLIALAIAFELALGFAMPKGAEGFALWQLHKSVGLTILLLTLIRLGWRLFRKPPEAVEGGLAGLLARLAHLGFYGFMLLAPLTGWALVSTSATRIPTMLFGLVHVPDLPLALGLNDAVGEAHEILAWLGLALIALHIAGVARHDLLLRHHSLRRMSPRDKAPLGVVLAAAVALVGAGTFLLVASQMPRERKVARVTAAPSPANAAPTIEPTAAATEEPAGLPEWSIQPGGRLGFSVENGADRIAGSFAKWRGTIGFDPDKPEKADIRIEIDLASAAVGDATQDQMLSGDEYFAVAAHPKAVVRLTSARKSGKGYTAQGTLQLKGTSRPLAVSFRLTGTGAKRHVEGDASIARAPFDIGMGETGAGLGPGVQVHFSFDAEAKAGN